MTPTRFLTPPTETSPDGVDLDLLRFLHRGPDGFVALARKQGDVWQPLGALPLDSPFLPGLGDALAFDAYQGLNTDYRVARRHERPIVSTGTREVYKPGIIEGQRVELLTTVPVVRRAGMTADATGLPHYHHTGETLRWLNACWVDLDCYRLGLDVGQALGAIVSLQDAGAIPPATMFARSGRGLWCFWLLVDARNPESGSALVEGVWHRPETPQRATRAMQRTFGIVQSRLAAQLQHLGADLQAKDAARFGPIPGTRKTYPDAQAQPPRVDYWLQALANGRCPAYTLPDLAQALDAAPIARSGLPRGIWVSDPSRAVSGATAEKNPELQARGRRGWLARWQGDLDDLRMLLEMRGGGLRQGQRMIGAWLLILISRNAGVAESEIRSAVETYAACCRPPFPRSEWEQALKAKRKRKQFAAGMLSRRRWHELINVTAAESSYLQHPSPPPVVDQAQRVTPDDRRKLVRQMMARNPGLSARAIAGQLAQLGYPGNHCTVAADLRALGLVSTRKLGGRPRTRPLLALTAPAHAQTPQDGTDHPSED